MVQEELYWAERPERGQATGPKTGQGLTGEGRGKTQLA